MCEGMSSVRLFGETKDFVVQTEGEAVLTLLGFLSDVWRRIYV